MDAVGQKLLDLAKSELGYSERSDGTTKFGEWWASEVDADHDAYFKDAPWCDMFLAYIADQAGVTEQAGQFASTPKHAEWFKDKGATTKKPEPGAIVFYDWSGNKDIDSISHVGIVTKVYSDGSFQALEANADDQVKYKTRHSDQVAVFALPAKVKVADKQASTTYAPKHSAPAPSTQQYMQDTATVVTGSGSAQSQDVSAPAAHDLPVKEAALTGAIGVAVIAVIALGMAKAAASRVPAAVAAAPEVRVRKKGRHHRTSGAPPVELPTGMSRYDFEEAEEGTMMMPAISAAVAAQVEDREFWGRIDHLKDDDELGFWTDLHAAVTQTYETNAELTGRR